MNTDGLDPSILGPALCAGLLVLATHVPLGREVLKRGIIFIDLAIAQIAGLGVIVAARFDWDAHGWAMQGVAMLCALFGAWILSRLERLWPRQQEALIGVTFVLAATASILLLADNPHGGEYLKELLVGQILWVTWPQMLPAAVVTVIVLLAWFRFRHCFKGGGFYLVFALAVTVSVQLVGVYLVFASLIIPALAMACGKWPRSLCFGYAIGGAGYILGLIASALLDLPSGATIVWAIVACALMTMMRPGIVTQ